MRKRDKDKFNHCAVETVARAFFFIVTCSSAYYWLIDKSGLFPLKISNSGGGTLDDVPENRGACALAAYVRKYIPYVQSCMQGHSRET